MNLKRSLRHFIFKHFVPVMVGKQSNKDGDILSNTRISNTTHIEARHLLNIENNVYIGHFNFIDASEGLSIGEGCQITNYVSILTHSSHISIRLYGQEYTKIKEPIGYVRGMVNLGAYTFIGPHSVIMPNTKIGRGCIVSAFSYVKGEFPDFSIISGNPAVITGDTRLLDKPFLDKYPEIASFYRKWSGL